MSQQSTHLLRVPPRLQLHGQASAGPAGDGPALPVPRERVQGKCSKTRRELREDGDAHQGGIRLHTQQSTRAVPTSRGCPTESVYTSECFLRGTSTNKWMQTLFIEFLPSTSAWKILLHPLKPNPCTTPTKSPRPAQVLLPHGPQAAGPLSTLDGGAKGPQPGNPAGAEAVFDSTVSETCGCLAQKRG